MFKLILTVLVWRLIVLALCFENFEIFSNIKQVERIFENVGTEFSSWEILQEPEAREDQLK